MATAGMTKIPVTTPMSVSTLRFDQFCPNLCIPSRLSVCTATVRDLRATLQCETRDLNRSTTVERSSPGIPQSLDRKMLSGAAGNPAIQRREAHCCDSFEHVRFAVSEENEPHVTIRRGGCTLDGHRLRRTGCLKDQVAVADGWRVCMSAGCR